MVFRSRIASVSCCALLLVGGAGCKRKSTPFEGGDAASAYKTTLRASSLEHYSNVCRSHAVFDGAKEYKKESAGAKPSKVAVFARYADDAKGDWTSEVPEALGAIAATTRDYQDVELVACVEMRREGEPGHCNFLDKELLLYTMKHTVVVVEAKTGKEVSKDEFVLEHKTARCPATYNFPAKTAKIFRGGDYGPKLASAILPLEPEGVALGAVTAVKLDDVCSGSAVPQAAAYTANGKAKVHKVYFPDEDPVFSRENLPAGMPALDDLATDAASYDLVACIVGKPEKKKASCDFTAGKVLGLYDGAFEVQLHEARTGKLVETKTFKATSSGACPTKYKFYGKSDKLMTKVEPAMAKYFAELEGERVSAGR